MLKTGLNATAIKQFHKMLDAGDKPKDIAKILRVKLEVLEKHHPDVYAEIAKTKKAASAPAQVAKAK